jgi:hypothetical protein
MARRDLSNRKRRMVRMASLLSTAKAKMQHMARLQVVAGKTGKTLVVPAGGRVFYALGLVSR